MGGQPVTDKFIAQIRGARTTMSGAQVPAMHDAAKTVKPVMEAAVVSMTGPSMTMRNVKPSGRITVTTAVAPTGNAAAAAEIGATGPIRLIENGAPGHTIAPKRSRRARGAIAAAGYPHPIARPIQHPGFRGKGEWRRAHESQARPAAKAAWVARNVEAFRKAFR